MLSTPLSADLRAMANWLHSFKTVMPGWDAVALPYKLLVADIPELLTKSAAVLERSSLPTALSKWPSAIWRLETRQFLRIVPVLGCFCLILSFVVAAVWRMLWRSSPRRRTFWLSRMLLVRGMALIYLAAFATSAAQSRALFGSLGLDPSLDRSSGRPTPAFTMLGYSDLALEAVSWAGLLLSMLVAGGLMQWAGAQLLLWVGYLSIVNLGARSVLGYGWEWATCEVGFLIIFLTTEWPTRTPFPRALPPPTVVLLLLRWYVFRLLIGAGQSKLGERSSACWEELSCTTTHYFTQPMPNPFAWLFHHLPMAFHRFEVALTFVEQLALPFLVLMPFRSLQHFAFVAELGLQLGIVGTGNCASARPPPFSVPRPLPAVARCSASLGKRSHFVWATDAWINWIGVLPAVALCDDAFLAHFLPRGVVAQAALADAEAVTGSGALAAAKRDYTRLATDEAAATEAESESDSGSSAVGKEPTTDLSTRAAASGILRSHLGSRGRVRIYRSARTFLHLILALFIACKSAAPIKELFTPAPWLHFYDDYFFVNAQGVFGFINSHRVNLVLSFTHDPLPQGRSQGRIDPSCRDTPGSIANAPDGRALACSDLAEHCGSHAQLQELCPKTCGRCGGRGAWLPSAVGKVAWRPLELKNLPGEPTRRPFFNSPYHYRFDWETWIQVTASMEHVMSRRPKGGAGGSLLDLPVPNHVQALVDKVLGGDTDAMNLLGTPSEDLLRLSSASRLTDSDGTGTSDGGNSHAKPTPPTAIKAEFYSFTFSNWDRLLHEGRWWDRELLSRPVIFERSATHPRPTRSQVAAAGNNLGVRRSPWQRHWLMLGAAVGVHASVRGLLGPSIFPTTVGSTAIACVNLLNHMAALAIYGLIAALALTSDYPNSGAAKFLSDTPLRGLHGILLLLPAFAILALTHAVSAWKAARGLHRGKSVVGALASPLFVMQLVALPAALFVLARDAVELQSKLLSDV